MVFYRKYRPQTITELDNEYVRETLHSVLSGSSAHAFLFTGPKGLGKTSAARIVAKVINCEKRKDSIEPCNKCSQCVSITNGTNLDILEIDAASNRGIDEIRDLREKIRLAPVSARKKVYIIDEVHMLTTEAFNALLKTLEEPPAHAVFILCTTEPHKVPETIVSRCLHIPFPIASETDLERSLKRIIKGEKLKLDNEALNYITHLSSGSFRDGAKILEEIKALSNRKKITKELVEKRYQISNIKYQLSQMLSFLAEKDAKAGLKLTAKIVEQGLDIKYFLEQLINSLHEDLLVAIGVEEARGPAARFSVEETKNLIELLTRAYSELKYAVLPQLPLELAIIEWGLNSAKAGPAALDARGTVTPRSASGQAPSALWNNLIQKVKSYNHSVAGVLRGCVLKSYDGEKLVVETGYKFHKERLEEKKTHEILEKVVEEIVGERVKVSVVLK